MTGNKRRAALCLVLIIVLTQSLGAANLPRDALWRVEQACMLNRRTTGAAFPCLDVDLTAGIERGHAILRAPLRQTHIVAMPTVRISGVEDARLRAVDAPDYLQDAWNARHYVQEEVKRPLGWTAIGLAVNSRLTRSQDQLHIHIDCVRQSVRRALVERLAGIPTSAWQADGFAFEGQSYWTRRIDKPDLGGVNPFALVDEIPVMRDHPARTVLALLGVTDPDGKDGFLLLAGQSDPTRAAYQSTSEDLLDHSCTPG